MWMALSGHSSTQVSQSTQSSTLITALSSTSSIAADGQMSTQVAHPVHFSLLTTAGIFGFTSYNYSISYPKGKYISSCWRGGSFPAGIQNSWIKKDLNGERYGYRKKEVPGYNPRTSFIVYTPGFAVGTHPAARIAPRANTALS